MMTSMPDVPVRLRPIEGADLDVLRRFDTDPSSRGPYLTSGFRSSHARRRRWEDPDYLVGGRHLAQWPQRALHQLGAR